MNAPIPLSQQAVPSVRKPYRLQWEEAQQAWVLLYPEGMIKLNASAGEIMRRCDGECSVGDITQELQRQFDQPDLRADVLAFMSMAQQQAWLAFSEPAHALADPMRRAS